MVASLSLSSPRDRLWNQVSKISFDTCSRSRLTLVSQIAVMSTASPYFSRTPHPFLLLWITSVRLPTPPPPSPSRDCRLRTPLSVYPQRVFEVVPNLLRHSISLYG